MKRLYYFLCAALCLSLFSACSDDPDPAKDVVYTLKADKTTVLVSEAVTFSVLSDTGENVTKDCSFSSEAGKFTGNSISWNEPGSHTITARYMNSDPAYPEGIVVSNEVVITVENSSTEVYTLTASKTTVKVGESLSFTITSSKDRDVTKLFQIVDDKDNAYPYPTSMYREEGKHTLHAIFKTNPEIRTANTVLISVTPASTTPDMNRFYQRSVMAEMTGTWCWSCPFLAKGIAYVQSNLLLDRVLPIAIHTPEQSKQGNMGNQYTVLNNKFSTQFAGQIPAYAIDWNASYAAVSYFANVVEECPKLASNILASQALDASPAGIKVETTLEGSLLKAKIYITAKESRDYYLGIVLVEDNIVGFQTSGGNDTDEDDTNDSDDYVHMNVGQGMFTDYLKVAESIGTIGVNEEKVLDYEHTIPAECNIDNCRVVIYVGKASTDSEVAPLGFLSSNAVSCPVGESIDYQYEMID